MKLTSDSFARPRLIAEVLETTSRSAISNLVRCRVQRRTSHLHGAIFYAHLIQRHISIVTHTSLMVCIVSLMKTSL
ncbi:hypothetical protein BDZ85DRAFT_265934 [Elsinoe ampelina]|uniref:Uncharacterized protein n=1 Tax=Elsinoe ampelina TaxID=302913 RepID=A0A6A6G5B8_9PEZI|nr:hypothetical protein BDZ85DRAFT_265934 [Elsinoe ampelina]